MCHSNFIFNLINATCDYITLYLIFSFRRLDILLTYINLFHGQGILINENEMNRALGHLCAHIG